MAKSSRRRSRHLRRGLAAAVAAATLLLRAPAMRADVSDLRLDGPPSSQPAEDDQPPPQMSTGATTAPYDPGNFRPDPDYRNKPYSAEDQYAIYGDKRLDPTQRPLLEAGEQLYGYGPVDPPNFLALGGKNPGVQHLWMFGDWRNGIGYNDNGKVGGDAHTGLADYASRLNLDFDYQFTSTERIHLFVRPLDKDNQITRYVFAGNDLGYQPNLNFNVDALFFEGDLGAITGGLTDHPSTFDLPITFGRIPLFFQNGIWMLDAIDGFAFTIPARNVPALDISNMDITFFAGFNHVDSAAVQIPDGKNGNIFDNDHEQVFGFNTFTETMGGYWEVGYGYTHDLTGRGFDYNNFTAAFTRRYGNFVSNSIRGIGNFGQDPNNHATKTANGFLLLVENSFMTGQSQQTIVPYLNLFAGFDQPQPLARDPGAGNVLFNTGINFETDALTGFPNLTANAGNAYGGALGCEFLFDLNRQLVFEFATVQTDAGRGQLKLHANDAPGAQYAFGMRFQQPLSNAVIFRLNAMYGIRNDLSDIAGISAEIRWKF